MCMKDSVFQKKKIDLVYVGTININRLSGLDIHFSCCFEEWQGLGIETRCETCYDLKYTENQRNDLTFSIQINIVELQSRFERKEILISKNDHLRVLSIRTGGAREKGKRYVSASASW